MAETLSIEQVIRDCAKQAWRMLFINNRQSDNRYICCIQSLNKDVRGGPYHHGRGEGDTATEAANAALDAVYAYCNLTRPPVKERTSRGVPPDHKRPVLTGQERLEQLLRIDLDLRLSTMDALYGWCKALS